MRRDDEISEEDRARVNQVTTSGIHSVERKPFRGLGAPGQPRTLIKLGGR